MDLLPRCLSFVVLSASLLSCVESTTKPLPTRLPDRSQRDVEAPTQAALMPWEVWSPFQDLAGQRLASKDLLLGDELVRIGKRRAALDSFLKASAGTLPTREQEVAALRVASQYLVMDEPSKALSTVTGYCKKNGLAEGQVPLHFSLILAFAYGRSGDIDQSLAWFSRSYIQSQGKGFGSEVSTKGSQLLLRSVQDRDFEQMALKWRSDQFINEQIGRERLRRASAGYVADDGSDPRPFWSRYGDVTIATGSVPIAPRVGGEPVVGVILSLSDKFGPLGRDTQQGLELAFAADPQQPPLKLELRDVGADTVAASAAVRELAAIPGMSVVVGPLLTEAAVSAAGTARELKVPLVSFSKSESFKTGDGVFRLGATSTSQVDALINVAYGDYHLTRYAAVYPESANGTEFVQAFRKKLAALNLPLVLEISYRSGDEGSMFHAASQLEKAQIDAFLIPDGIEVSARLLSALSPAARKRMRPLGTALWDNPTRIANSQSVFAGALFVTPFFPQSTRPIVQQFVQSYRGKYQSAPNFLAAQGFDVGTIVRTALRASQKSGKGFAEALATVPPYDGITGAIAVDSYGEFRRRFNVVEVTSDLFVEKTPGAEPRSFDGSIVFKGDQQLDPGSREPLQGSQDRVASGY